MAETEISLTQQQLRYIRRRVREGMDDIEAGRFTEYEGREGLKKLAEEVKARGREHMAAKSRVKANQGGWPADYLRRGGAASFAIFKGCVLRFMSCWLLTP